MPPDRPPLREPADHDREERLHEMFAGFRAWLRPTQPGRRAAVLDAIRAARSARRRGPAIGTVLSAGLVQILNLLASALGRSEPPHAPATPPHPDEPDDDQH